MICPFFNRCGGCHFQDLPFEAYKQKKIDFIKGALTHAGIDFPLSDFISIGAHTRRRATFAFANGIMGFNAKKSHQIIAIDQCLVLLPELEKLIKPLSTLVHHLSGTGDIAVLMTEFGADITISSEKQKEKRFHKRIKKSSSEEVFFLEEVSAFCAQNNVARFIKDGQLLYQSVQLDFPPNVFMQPSVEGQNALVDLVLKHTQDSHKVLDLFCGLGTFTKPLYQAGKRVTGMDITEESIAALKKHGVMAEVRDLFRNPVLPDELNQYDTIVLDPARAGAMAEVQQIALSNVKKVVMVSCNPLTFAKDCRVLIEGGFHFKQITPVDQFIFSDHIELVALLERA